MFIYRNIKERTITNLTIQNTKTSGKNTFNLIMPYKKLQNNSKLGVHEILNSACRVCGDQLQWTKDDWGYKSKHCKLSYQFPFLTSLITLCKYFFNSSSSNSIDVSVVILAISLLSEIFFTVL